jgi:phosphate starvation-inducible membrane PsiE
MSMPRDKLVKSFFKRCDEKLNSLSDELGNLLVNIFHQLALFAIGAATVWASIHAFVGMVKAGESSIENLLLLFIYLEIGAMVGIYFKTNRMPVRFLIYVAITALTRLLISVANHHEAYDATNIVLISGAILLLTGAVLVLRFGSFRFPTDPGIKSVDDDS